MNKPSPPERAPVAWHVTADAEQRRRKFRADLASSFDEHDIDLVSAALGRRENGIPVWRLTIQHPTRGIISLAVPFHDDPAPYSRETLERLVERVVRHMSKTTA
jgi:hypothetical protein